MRKFVALFVYVITSGLVLGCGGAHQTSIIIDHGIGSVAPSGSAVVSPTATTFYPAVANGNGKATQASATVTVNQTLAAAPTIQLSANPSTISAGGQTTLSWSSQGATSIIIDHGIGSVAPSGSIVVSPTATTVYTAGASGNGQTTQATATVTVNVPTGSIESVKHIIFMLQENRTFDNYFGQLNQYRQKQGLPQDVDGLPSNASNPSYDGTAVVPAYHIKTVCAENQSPSWDEEHVDANRYDPASTTATMDGFVHVAG